MYPATIGQLLIASYQLGFGRVPMQICPLSLAQAIAYLVHMIRK
jgi:hypothetical protein